MSPGRRYLATGTRAGDTKIQFFRMSDGQAVGTILFAANSSATLDGLAFSPNGRMLAAVCQQRVQVWDLGKPRLASDIQVPSEQENLDRSLVEWIGDGPLLLIGDRAIIDSQGGHRVGTVDPMWPPYKPPFRVVGGNAVLVSRQVSNGPQSNRLVSETLHMDRLLLARDMAATGGTVEDVGLPPFTKVTMAGAVKQGEVPVSANRLAELDTAVAGADPLLTRPIAVPVPTGAQVTVFVPPTGRFALISARGGTGNPGDTVPHVCVADLIGTQPPKPVNVDGPREPLAISPDGARGLFLTGAQRLDVFDLNPWRYVVGWHLEEDVGAVAGREGLLLDRERALFHSKTHATLWKLPECRGLYVANVGSGSLCAVSPGGRYVVAGPPGIHLHNLETGVRVATLSVTGWLKGAAFSPDGRHVAAAYDDDGNHMTLVVWDVIAGDEVRHLSVPSHSTAGMALVGENYVILDDLLFDLTTGAAVWRCTGRRYQPSRPVGAVWVGSESGGTFRLGAMTLPHQAAQKAIAAHGPVLLSPLVGPGVRVRLDIRGEPNEEALRNELTVQFGKAGMIIADDGPVIFRIIRGEAKSETSSYDVFGGRRGVRTETATFSRSVHHLAWLDAAGHVFWQQDISTGCDPGFRYNVPENESLQNYLQRTCPDQIQSIHAPTLMLAPAEATILGTSQLTPDGVKD